MRELSLHILDIVQNSVVAGADLITILINEDIKNDNLSILIEDNGCGMSPEMVKKVRDPFVTTRTTRKVGMGISLFESAAVACDGHLDLESEVGKGTKITAYFKHSHIDRMPIGDMAQTYAMLAGGNLDIDFVYTHIINGNEFVIDTRELKNILGEVPLDSPDVLVWIRDYINEGINNLQEV